MRLSRRTRPARSRMAGTLGQWVPAVALLLCVSATTSPAARGADYWDSAIGPYRTGGLGAGFGSWSWSRDGWDGQSALDLQGHRGVFLLLYREHGPAWGGPTGFFGDDYESPIPWGGSKTWWDFYLWSQNYTPDPPDEVTVITATGDRYWPPSGYTGHLVLDEIPASAGWTGPMDYWLDLTKFNYFTLPIATVTDPLQGTRFHLTVYAIPEPSSLALLGLAALGVAARVIRRRR